MNSCSNERRREQLPEWAARRLPPTERAAVDAHLAACASCRAEAELLAAARRALPAPPAVDVARIVAALPAPPRPGGAGSAGHGGAVLPIGARPGNRRPLLVALAAAGAIAAAGAGLMLAPAGAPPTPVRPGIAAAPVTAVPSAAAGAAGVDLAYLDAATLTAAEYDALMDHLEGTDAVLAPVAEPPADSLLGGV